MDGVSVAGPSVMLGEMLELSSQVLEDARAWFAMEESSATVLYIP
jgi:hypothetical protein